MQSGNTPHLNQIIILPIIPRISRILPPVPARAEWKAADARVAKLGVSICKKVIQRDVASASVLGKHNVVPLPPSSGLASVFQKPTGQQLPSIHLWRQK